MVPTQITKGITFIVVIQPIPPIDIVISIPTFIKFSWNFDNSNLALLVSLYICRNAVHTKLLTAISLWLL